jgi:hypothetical protein
MSDERDDAVLLREAESIIAEAKAIMGQRIRVVRAVVYEGNAAEVMETLARSLPIGAKQCVGYTIRVAQGPIEVVSANPPAVEADPRRRFRELVYDTRRRTDPEAEWSLLEPPLTDAQLDAARGGYTCDVCELRRTCPLVYDSYNVDGDCILEK